ncbi:MAG: insulinase family protein [Paludibacter sp.]|jgi:predicted Zn-dependent peptidase|nr:insulinase family protein [Paludibacter sp.]
MKKFFIFSFVVIMGTGVWAQSFTTYKLNNGLTVYLWEDHDQPNVYGSVAVRAGSIDEPLEYTGLAHYLEHVLFKGTDKIGSFDWEKERPLYEQIIALYDDFASTADAKKRAEIEKRINEISIEAAQYGSTSEFSNLVQSIGGSNLNAGTSYDQTEYHNTFPSSQIEKWLDLYSERFINPVFRSFQAELENVFEEYNMYEDYSNTHIRKFLFSNIYKGHPYGRDIIGSPEHLKNPRLSKLIEFYNTWYVPNNMALILVGDFKTDEVMPLIEKKFSRLKEKPLPQRPTYPDANFAGNPKYKAKIGDMPILFWTYKGVKAGDEDEFLLGFCTSLLSNSMSTGLLDKITMDGDVQGAGASLDTRRDQGRILIQAVPYFDSNTRTYESDKTTEKTVMKEVEKIKNGEIDDYLIQSVKNEYLRDNRLILESLSGKISMLQHLFVYQLPDDYFYKQIAQVRTVTKDKLQTIAQKYLSGDHITVSIEEGEAAKNKLKKPNIKPVESVSGKQSEYFTYFKNLPAGEVKLTYNNFADVTVDTLYKGVRLHYSTNPRNNYFTLTLKYGVGTEKMPKLEYAVSLMNSAGIQPSTDAQIVRYMFGALDANISFSVSDSYFYISVLGKEDKLQEICNLLTKVVVLPKLDDKQLNNVIGYEISNRLFREKKSASVLSDASVQYALYKEKSDYIDRLSLTNLIDLNTGLFKLSVSELTGEINRATNYEMDIFYVGKDTFNTVRDILLNNLPMKDEKFITKSESPVVKERVKYDRSTIYFLNNSKSQQAQIYFYFEGDNYTLADEIAYDAFAEYFSGGFSGLVMQEVREKRSMAYTAIGSFRQPPIPNKNAFFLGYVGTQPDKAADAIDVYMDLLKDMPEYPDRIDGVKTAIKEGYLAAKPSFRAKPQVFDIWKRAGYTADPAKVNEQKINDLKFEDIVNFYNQKVKGKPITIVIVGDGKLINQKQIEAKHGKITKLSTAKIFKGNDLQ